MTSYKVGYLSAASPRARSTASSPGAGPARPAGTWNVGDLLRRPAALQLRLRRRLPAGGTAFKAAIAAVDAVLFVTPEYNRSIPGGLKNAIDWASRPYGTNAFTRKPSAIIGTSPGAIGTAIAQQHLRSMLGLLQLAADECAGGLHPVYTGA